MTSKLAFFTIFLIVVNTGFTQQSLLQSGPMVGYSEMKEVAIWAQTNQEAYVSLSYWEKDLDEKKYQTETIKTTKKTGFTALLIADSVLPGRLYDYQLIINNIPIKRPYPCLFRTQSLWQWRTDPPDFKFVIGSCNYVSESQYDRPGKPYGGDYGIFKSIDQINPEMMLWLGDNIYLREVDWNTQTGINYRYTHTRSLPEMQPLLARTHHYAIWDDHDFGPNDSHGSFTHKDITLEAFKNFWANPSYGINGKPGITSQFSYNDCDFFLLDNRYNRTPVYDSANSEILGSEQIDWLIAALKASRSPFKFVAVGGQFLNSAKTYENHSRYPKERDYILKRIADENIKGVVFLNGDRHHGEISKLTLQNKIDVYDITSSPLTSRAHKKVKEYNEYRVEGSLITERHFTVIDVTGAKGERLLTIESFNTQGESIFTYSINQP
ncbi:MAG: alkaline phosphatase D family protein [Salibacteraceae bacterium]